jgi:hypothetical protein
VNPHAHFVAVRRKVRHSVELLPYAISVVRRRPRNEQVALLPRRLLERVHWVELTSIDLAMDVRHWRRPTDGFAAGGDWDRRHVSPRVSIFNEAPPGSAKISTHATIRSIFLEDNPYTETCQFAQMMCAVREGRPDLAYGCTEAVDVHHYFERLLDAYRTMQATGFLTQHELGGSPGDEIKLFLTRDGSLCHGNGGNHRIRIAELLGIRWVPFVLAGVHSSWLVEASIRTGRAPRAVLRAWFRTGLARGRLRRHSPESRKTRARPTS